MQRTEIIARIVSAVTMATPRLEHQTIVSFAPVHCPSTPISKFWRHCRQPICTRNNCLIFVSVALPLAAKYPKMVAMYRAHAAKDTLVNCVKYAHQATMEIPENRAIRADHANVTVTSIRAKKAVAIASPVNVYCV